MDSKHVPLRSRAQLSAGLLIAALGAPGASQAGPIERIELEAGTGNHVDIFAVGIGTREWFTKPIGAHWSVSSYVLGRVAYWGSLDDHPRVSAVYDFSVTPVVRLERPVGNCVFFLELGVGLHALTHTYINADRTFGSAIQFGEFFGPGVRFGEGGRYEVSLRVQHVSNGGIRDPNDGLTYGSVALRYVFP
jgi:lipid A 3-O-deacylase